MQQDLWSIEKLSLKKTKIFPCIQKRIRARLSGMTFRAATPTAMEIMLDLYSGAGKSPETQSDGGRSSRYSAAAFCPQISTLDFHRAGEAIAAGHQAVEKKMDELLPLVCTAV